MTRLAQKQLGPMAQKRLGPMAQKQLAQTRLEQAVRLVQLVGHGP